MPTRAVFAFRDHEDEASHTLVWVQDVGDANYGSVTTDIDEIRSAMDAITLGTITEDGFDKRFPQGVGYPSTDPQAQREKKWNVTYQDNMQFLDEANTIANPGYLKIFNTEIPTADLSLLPTGSEFLDITASSGAVHDFVASWQANARTPYNHTNGKVTPPATFNTVLSIQYVGRKA